MKIGGLLPYILLPLLAIILSSSSCNTEVEDGKVEAAKSESAAVPVVQDGWQEVQIPDGGVMKGEMKDGLRQGPWTSYFASGTIRSRGNYVDGELDGPTEVYHPNGMTYYTGQYSAGITVGEWVFFDEAGVLVKTAVHDSTGTLLEQR